MQIQQLNKFDQNKMAETIKYMKEFYQEEHETLSNSIRVHTDRFNEQDNQDFHEFLLQLNQENMAKIAEFWQQKAGSKNSTFESYNSSFQQNFQELLQNMAMYKNDLSKFFTDAKQKEVHLENRIDLIVRKEIVMNRQKKAFKIWKDWIQQRKIKQESLDFADEHYRQNLNKKSFISWRQISYKPAFEEKIYQSSETDIVNVQKHYLDIIQVLRNKIRETEDLVEIKKQAKAEFAYGLSKNLMKTISNLSMEVMSLNQITLKDQRVDVQDTQQFIDQINNVVENKKQQISDARQNIKKHVQIESSQKKKGSVISFSGAQVVNLDNVSLDRQD